MNSKHLSWRLKEIKPKTAVYEMVNKSDFSPLGLIKWHSAWRQYCFFPYADCVWSSGCLFDLQIFIKELMQERKGVKDLTKATRGLKK